MNDDLISRQAVIDAINEYFSRIAKLKRKGLTEGEKAISLDVVGAIKSLSSVQREQSIVEWQKDFREYINMLNIPRDDYNGIMEYIDELPSAQKHGRWKGEGMGDYSCSLCGKVVSARDYRYCPYCGAKMDAERKEE